MKTINAQDTYNALQDNTALLIDVREQDEYDEAHIEGAVLCPLSDLPQQIQNIDFESAQNANKKIIFQCLKGGRSAQAINFAQENILKNVDLYNLEGGILAWIAEDLPVIQN